MAILDQVTELKIILREESCSFFSDIELQYYLKLNNYDLNSTAYQCLQIKAEDTTLNVSGLSCADTSKYFRRLSQKYVSHNSGTLVGG